MRYTPKKNKKNTDKQLYTSGFEYMFINGENYKGYYHLHNNHPYTESNHNDNSILLFDYKTDINLIKYLQLKPNLTNNKLITFMPSPSETNYDNGSITRYLIKKRNDRQIYEIDKIEFKKIKNKKKGVSEGYYSSVEIEWKLTGPIHDIFENNILITHGIEDTNRRTIKNKESEMNGLIKHFANNYMEFGLITQ